MKQSFGKVCVLAGLLAFGPASASERGDTLQIHVDATRVVQGVYHVSEVIPAKPGPLTLRFPKWLPGHHSPSGRVDAMGGLAMSAGGKPLPWSRDLSDMYVFTVVVPAGQTAIQAEFDFMTPILPAQGRISMTPAMLELEWDMAALYPAGRPANTIRVSPSVKLPEGWAFATALEPGSTSASGVTFAETDVATLVDSPLLAAPTLQKVGLGDIAGVPVRLNLAQDPNLPTPLSDERIKNYREMVRQVQLAFGASSPFAHYDLLVTLSDEVGRIGWEHLQSSEVGSSGSFYSEWKDQVDGRLTLPHEYIHAWNGKYRRPIGLASPDFSKPMSGALLWVYEGMTQYYAFVISARSGILSDVEARDFLAAKASRMGTQSGRQWRSLEDTTNEPSVNPFHTQAAWSDWRRNVNDYYDEGTLLWLEVDTKIRELTNGRKSLDDFATPFFRVKAPTLDPKFYTLDDVVAGLDAVARHDWRGFFQRRVYDVRSEQPVGGVDASGWQLTYNATPQAGSRSSGGALDLLDTLGLIVNDRGEVSSVRWDSPAAKAGLTPNAVILAANGSPFTRNGFREMISRGATSPEPITLIAKQRAQVSTLKLDYHGGLTYPHLARRDGSPDRLSEIAAPRTTPVQ